MRIAHISDLHFTTFFKKSNLGSINYMLEYAFKHKADHIVITGDLTDNADKNDFLILRDLFENLGILSSEKLSLVIGNHDIFGGVQTAEDIFSFPEKCRSVNFNEKVQDFYSYFSETFDNCVYFSEDTIFPFAKILDGVLIAGMNSIAEYSKAKNIFASNGAVSIAQFDATLKILENFNKDVHTKIVLIHHHFSKIKSKNSGSFGGFWQNIEKQTMKLRKKKRLLNLFNQYDINLVLHGHYHETKEYHRNGIRFLNAGGSFKNQYHNELFINFIDVDPSIININTHNLPSPREGFEIGDLFSGGNNSLEKKFALAEIINN